MSESEREGLAAHRADATRQLALGEPVAASTIRGLLDAIDIAELERLRAIERAYVEREQVKATARAEGGQVLDVLEGLVTTLERGERVQYAAIIEARALLDGAR